MIKIKNIYFEDMKSLSSDITDKLDSLDEFGDISVIAKYSEVKEIIRELICAGYDIASLEVHEEEYWDEYILSIAKVDEVPEIWCEKFKRKNGYFDEQSSITYILDNCGSKCLATITSPLQYEVSIGNDDEGFEDSCNDTDVSESTHISRTKDGKIAGFSKSWSTSKDGVFCYSSYSSYSDDEDTVKSIAHDFGINI